MYTNNIKNKNKKSVFVVVKVKDIKNLNSYFCLSSSPKHPHHYLHVAVIH